MALFNLSEKVAVITGAGSGIGKSIAQLFARQGAKVYVLDISPEQASQCVQEIQAQQGWAAPLTVDISQSSQVKQTFDEIFEQEARIDILINNAGIAHVGKLEDTSEEDLDRIYQVNIKGVYNCLRAVIDKMKQQRQGVILNLASVASLMGIPDRFAYSMSKGAVLTMTYSVARDYLEYNVRCNCIAPARIHTPFVDGFLAKNYPGREQEMMARLARTQPIGRMGTPDEVAHLALYLCSDEAAFITGDVFPIDGGFLTLNS
ncbi:MAG: glucose 1-dehydrogenase [Bacteroidia bacterium]|nr:glucose 1-dehydrogenase [Bacteroidia bacterium]